MADITRWPTNDAGTPKPPRGLSKQAVSYWSMVVNEYALEDSALMMLESALRSLDRAEECARQIMRDGLTPLDRFGMPREHPLLQCERACRGAYVQTLNKLGLDFEPIGGIGVYR